MADQLRKFLREQGIYSDVSGHGSSAHFEILCTEDEEEQINRLLDQLEVEA